MVFKSFDGKEIFVREWLNVENPRGVIQISHGMAEHSERYDRLARELNGLGFVVFADDHRGHGDTDPDTLGYDKGDMFENTLKDMAALAKHYKEKYPALKYILYGHSYGSFLTQAFISRYSYLCDAAVLSGSSYQKDLTVFMGYVIASLGVDIKGGDYPSEMLKKMSFGSYEKKFADHIWLSVDKANNDKYDADPMCGFTCSNNFYKSFMHGLIGLYTAKYISGLNKDMPLLIISGKDDAVGNMSKGVTKLADFYRKNGMKNVTLHLIENSRHEFMNEEANRSKGLQQITEFLNSLKF